jgi:hypothetical protein
MGQNRRHPPPRRHPHSPGPRRPLRPRTARSKPNT